MTQRSDEEIIRDYLRRPASLGWLFKMTDGKMTTGTWHGMAVDAEDAIAQARVAAQAECVIPGEMTVTWGPRIER